MGKGCFGGKKEDLHHVRHPGAGIKACLLHPDNIMMVDASLPGTKRLAEWLNGMKMM